MLSPCHHIDRLAASAQPPLIARAGRTSCSLHVRVARGWLALFDVKITPLRLSRSLRERDRGIAVPASP